MHIVPQYVMPSPIHVFRVIAVSAAEIRSKEHKQASSVHKKLTYTRFPSRHHPPAAQKLQHCALEAEAVDLALVSVNIIACPRSDQYSIT